MNIILEILSSATTIFIRIIVPVCLIVGIVMGVGSFWIKDLDKKKRERQLAWKFIINPLLILFAGFLLFGFLGYIQPK